MPVRHVHFAESDDHFSYSSTPSPSYSDSSLPSSSGPHTPPPLNHTTSPYSSTPLPPVGKPLSGAVYIIHPALGFQPTIPFDISCDPFTTVSPPLLSPRVLAQSATYPPLSRIIIRSRHLPWVISITPSSSKSGAFVTVADVLVGLYTNLRTRVSPTEFSLIPTVPEQSLVTAAFMHRCRRLKPGAGMEIEISKGVRRIDFLMENHRFLGLSSTTEGPEVWKLSVSP